MFYPLKTFLYYIKATPMINKSKEIFTKGPNLKNKDGNK